MCPPGEDVSHGIGIGRCLIQLVSHSPGKGEGR